MQRDPKTVSGGTRGRAEPLVLSSRELFKHGDTVRIVHNDQVYLLRRTRENKLILTK